MGETDWGGNWVLFWLAGLMLFNPIFCWWMRLCSLPVFWLEAKLYIEEEDDADLLQKVPCMHSCTQCPRPWSRPPLTHASARGAWTHTGKSGSVSCVTAPFSWVLVCTRFCLCPPSVCFPVLCKFWWLYGGINGDLLQEGLCHTQVCCIQSPCSCDRPLLTHTSTGDTQTLKGRSCAVSVGPPGSHKGLFEPSKHLWQVQGLSLNVISLPLPSCWGFSFAPGHGVSFLVGSNILHQRLFSSKLQFWSSHRRRWVHSFYSAILQTTHCIVHRVTESWIRLGDSHLSIYIEGNLDI